MTISVNTNVGFPDYNIYVLLFEAASRGSIITRTSTSFVMTYTIGGTTWTLEVAGTGLVHNGSAFTAGIANSLILRENGSTLLSATGMSVAATAITAAFQNLGNGHPYPFYDVFSSDSVLFNGSDERDIFAFGRRNDVINGNGGDDFFAGLAGADTINGGAGYDRVSYYEDAYYGGSAGAIINLSANTVNVGGRNVAAGTAVDGFGNIDTLISIEEVVGTNANDRFYGGNGYAFFQGVGGSDTYVSAITVQFADWSIANYLNDVSMVDYRLDGGTLGVIANLSTGVGADTYGNAEYYTNIIALRGSMLGDSFTGNQYWNWFQGLKGDDYLDGGGGMDVADYRIDYLFGGTAGIYVDLSSNLAFDGFGDLDRLTNIETIYATDFSDQLLGDVRINRLYGYDGDDFIEGGDGGDTLAGDWGQDTVSYRYSSASVTVDLGAQTASGGHAEGDILSGFESVLGSAHADILFGDAASNGLTGGAGSDWLFGGGGADGVMTGGDMGEADNAIDWLVYDVAADAGDRIASYHPEDIIYFGGTSADPDFGFDALNPSVNGVVLYNGVPFDIQVITQASTALLAASPETIASLLSGGIGALAGIAGGFRLHIFDANNNDIWRTNVWTYNSAGWATERYFEFDDSTGLRDGYDLAGLLDWTEDYDATGALTRYTNFDQDGTEGEWTSFYDLYSGGVRTQRFVNYDNGTSQREGFYASYNVLWRQEYDATDTLIRYTEYDVGDAVDWADYYNLYVAGIRTQQYMKFDDGTAIRNGYDAAGNLDWVEEYWDAGVTRSRYVDYDQAGDQTWTYAVTYYDINGAQTSRYILYDDGSELYL